MISSGLLDLAIGLLFIFLVFSLVVSGINEAITKVIAWRSRHLWRNLRMLLDGEGLELREDQRPKSNSRGKRWTDRLYAHPLIRQLEGRLPTSRSRISNIPHKDFARALIDLLAPNGQGATTVAQVRAQVRQLPDELPLKAPTLAILSESEDKLDQLRQGIGEWFDTRMGELSRTYRRHARLLLIAIGLAVAVALNIDAIGAAEQLYRDEALRSAIAQQATTVVEGCEDASDVAACTKRKVGEIDTSLRLPVGWIDGDKVDALQLLGWLIAGLALGQGAPFWFDLLRKARQMRAQP